MERKSQQRQKKTLSAKGLFSLLRNEFQNVPPPESNLDESRGRERKIPFSDCLMSGLALFSLKYPSLLQFDQDRHEDMASYNLRSLYGIEQAPSDTYMREQLDEVLPMHLRRAFLSIFKECRKGKLLEEYRFMDGYLILADGTQVFNSESVHCDNCCQKNHRDGRVSYYHQVLGTVIAHPNRRQVIPLCPEPITKIDGNKKNDCERNAMSRFLKDLKSEHPKLKCTIGSDALSANALQINEILSYGYDYIINVKKDGNRSLFEWLDGLDLEENKVVVGKNEYVFRYINGIPLNQTKNAPEVNFLECKVIEYQGNKRIKKTFTWVTSHTITKKNVYLLMQGGRARWKVENETFNTLKNQGYQFEHNFGHGKKNLHTVFMLLMMLAFLVDQIQEAVCGLFKTGLEHMRSRTRFWRKMRSRFDSYFIDSWEDLLRSLGPSFEGTKLSFDTS